MGIINVNIDSGLQSEPFYPSASILEISTRYNETPYFQKIKREPLVFNLTFAFENGFDDDKLRETARWLNQKTFKELYFSNQPDKKYFAIYEGSPRLFHTGADGYFEITFRTNSPYAHSDLIETGIYNQVSPALAFSRPSPAIHPETGAEVPADTPIFMTFAGDKRGLLMEEGTENLFSTPLFIDADSNGVPDGWSSNGSVYNIREVVETERGMAFHIRRESGSGDYFLSQRKTFEAGKTYTIAIDVFDITNSGARPETGYRMGPWGLSGYDHVAGTHRTNLFTSQKAFIDLGGGWWRVFVTFTIDEDSGGSVETGPNSLAVGREFYFIYPQIEQKPHPTSFTVGTRAIPSTLLTLPEALPEEFGVGIAAKMLHAHGIKSRTFWQAGDYHRLFYDMADSKIKMQYGGAIAETSPVSWSADDIIGVYGGKKDGKLFVQAKVAGELGEKTAVEVGGRNLLLLSDVEVTNAIYGIARYDFSESPIEGETYTLTLKGTLGEDRESFCAYNSGGFIFLCRLIPNEDGTIFSKTFTWRVTSGEHTASNTYLRMYQFLNTGTSESTIEWIKLERGNEATPWTPAPEDGDTNDLYIGSLPDESENVNAVIADFTLHDSGDIDPEGYLSRVPGGGV